MPSVLTSQSLGSLRRSDAEALRIIADANDKRLPEVVRGCLAALGLGLKKQILDFDRMIMAWHCSNQTSKRLKTAFLASVRCWPLLWWRVLVIWPSCFRLPYPDLSDRVESLIGSLGKHYSLCITIAAIIAM